jgi:hypothetical protein
MTYPVTFAINPYFVIAVYRKTAIDLPLFLLKTVNYAFIQFK